MNDVKKKIYLIVGITLLLLGLSSTFAWVVWFSEEDTDVNFAINGLDITSTNVDISGTIYPTNDKTKGIVKEFTVVQNSELNSSVCADFTLTLTNLPTELIHESFKYVIYNGETLVGKGHFGNSSQGDIITVATSQPVTTTISTYKIYIWIDGLNYENPYEMFGQNFLFTLGITANQQEGECNPSDLTTSEVCFEFDGSTGTITGYNLSEHELSSYDVHQNCVKNIINSWEYDEEDAILYCSGQSDSSGNTMAGDIEGGYAKEMLTCGIITNVVYTYYGSCGGDVIIPKSINGVDVTSIGDYAFQYNNLTSVTIPGSIIVIGRNSFAGNLLTNVVIPDSVTTIGTGAFQTNLLINAVIPDSVTSIVGFVFYENNLTSVIIPNSVTSIGNKAFAENALTNVAVPDSVTSISSYAFQNNDLRSIYIGKNSNLNTIGSKAFSSSSSVSSSNHIDNPSLTIIYNNSGKAFDWTNIITGTTGTAFATGNTTITNGNGNLINITTGGTP